MVRIRSLITWSAAFVASRISAQSTLCQYFGLSPLQCAICGYTPSSPVYCVAYNATFDDLPAGSLSSVYKNTAWPGFSVLTQSTLLSQHTTQKRPTSTTTKVSTKRSEDVKEDFRLTHKAGIRSLVSRYLDATLIRARQATTPVVGLTTLSPQSPSNYAIIPAGGEGSLVFGKEGGVDPVRTNGQLPAGALHYFFYACAVPGTNPPVAAACNITISGSCLPQNAFNFQQGPFVNFSTSMTYDPALPTPGSLSSMQEVKTNFAQSGYEQGLQLPQKCSNYTFSAAPIIGTLGALPATSVELLLDNIIYNTFSIGYR